MKFVKSLLVISVVALSVSASAQQVTPQQKRPSDAEINTMLQTLQSQRDAAQNQVVQMTATMTTMEQELKACQATEKKPGKDAKKK